MQFAQLKRREFMALLGGAVAWPLMALAQQAGKRYRVSYLALVPGEDSSLLKPFFQRLHELGYHEGTNLAFEYRSAEGHLERLAPLAMELVQTKPDVLVAGFGTLAAQAAKAATTTIPIVFTTVGDPLGAGVIASLNRPGGNITGLTDQARDVEGKRLQLLQELIPGKRHIAVLLNPDTPFTRLALEEAKAAAEYGHIHLEVLEARTPGQVSDRFDDAAKAGANGLLVLDDPLIFSIRGKVAELAMQFRLPAIYVDRGSTEAGGLMSYGPDRRQIYRRAAEYVDKILKGAKPADLAVEQPTKFELIINLKTAKALGLEVPASLLARADEVIE
jgi:putative tryptophan/tyrosine transport system substrate-binding protein